MAWVYGVELVLRINLAANSLSPCSTHAGRTGQELLWAEASDRNVVFFLILGMDFFVLSFSFSYIFPKGCTLVWVSGNILIYHIVQGH